jgi:uncharacterized MnhB-related membrane protein
MPTTLLGSIWMLVFGMLAGIVSFALLHPFSYAYALFCIATYYLVFRLSEKRRDLAITTASLGSVFLWISLWLSIKILPQSSPVNVSAPIESAGFPFTAFLYPHPPMGNDVPPLNMWPPFFLNAVIWMSIAWVILHITKRFGWNQRKIYPTIIILGILCSLIGLGYTLVKFD